MAIVPSGIAVPAQSKTLDNVTVTTAYGIVYRQIISIADPESPTSYVKLTGTSLNVNVTNTSLSAVQSGTWNITNISGTVSLPTGASTSYLQTTGNTSLSSIDTKTPSLSSGRVPVESNLVQALTDLQLRATPVPISFARLSSAADSVSAVQSGTWNITNISGTVSLPTGAATESTLAALSNKFNNNYENINTNTTTTVKSGAGVLKRIVVNMVGASSNTCTIYDNTSGTGTIIGTIDPVHSQIVFEYDVIFNTGLTIVTATGTAADLTIVYQ